MSGGEKSLTALSFIFALQRYRPSPFYAFDEVDMFLDGANVQRLANMIQQQAQDGRRGNLYNTIKILVVQKVNQWLFQIIKV